MKLTSTPLSITLYGPDGNELTAVQLPEPILLTLRADATEDDQCVFWEKTSSMWSTEGIKRMHDGSSNLVCATNHLSLFGSIAKAFVRTLVCSNIRAIFSLEGLKTLLRSPWWTIRAPAITLWATLLVFACVFFHARMADAISHETTLTAEKAHEKSLRSQGRAPPVQQKSSMMSTVWNAAWQLNAFVGFMNTMGRKFCSKDSGSGLGLVPLQMQLDIIIRSRVGIGRQSLQSAGCTEMKRSGQNAVQKFRKSSFVDRAAFLFKAKQPLLAAMQPNFELSHAARVAVLCTMLLGSSAASALFFATAGGAAGSEDPEECQSSQTWQDELVESCTIGILSALFSGLPAMAFLALPRRRLSVQTRNAARRYYSFWILLCLYGLLCLFVVATFLAKVTATDGNRWLISMLASAAQKLVLSPFILSVSMASYTSIAFRVIPRSTKQLFSQRFIDDDDEIGNGPTLLRCPSLPRDKDAALEPADTMSRSADIDGIKVGPCCTEAAVSHELQATVKIRQKHVLDCPPIDAYVSHAGRNAGMQETQFPSALSADKLQPARDEHLASLDREANTTFGKIAANLLSDTLSRQAAVEQECIGADVCRGETDAGNCEAQRQVANAADNLQSVRDPMPPAVSALDTEQAICERVVVELDDVVMIPMSGADLDEAKAVEAVSANLSSPKPGASSPGCSCVRDAHAPSAHAAWLTLTDAVGYDEAEQDRVFALGEAEQDRVFALVNGPLASTSRRSSSPLQRRS